MSAVRLLLHQFRYDAKTFWRDPAALFFTVALPVIFLLVFVTIFGNETLESRGGIKLATYYVPGIAALAIISATFMSLSIGVTELRERGVLKRLRGTPLPAWAFIAARAATAAVVSVALVVVLVALGRIVYGVSVPESTLPGFLLALVVGAASFCALGFALTVVIPTANAAPAVANAFSLPLYFISGLFFPIDQAPEWLQTVAGVFPVAHLSEALFTAFDPSTRGLGIALADLAVVAAWGAAGLAIAVWKFRWTPRSA